MTRWACFFLVVVGLLALLVGVVSRTAQVGPAVLRFERSVVDLGACEPRAERAIAFPWKRLGGGSLRVVGVRADCSCLRHEGLPAVLDPGSQGALGAWVRIPTRPGPVRVTLRVYVDSERPAAAGSRGAAGSQGATVHQLHVRGYVERPFVLVPDALRVGRHSAGRWLAYSVEMRGTEAFARRALSRLRARLVLLGGGDQDAGALLGEARVEPPRAARDAVCVVHLRFQVPRQPGPVRAALQLDLGEKPLAQVPVSFESVPAKPVSAESD